MSSISFLPSRAIALSVGSLQIHWYGLLYLLAFLIGMWLLPRLLKYRKLVLSAAQKESLLLAVFLGVLLGGRLGFILFYGGSYYVQHPWEILAVWHGGMSSHGGFIGVLLALLLYCRKERINFFALADVLVVPVAIGLALGRLGNFINGELYGSVTTLPLGIHFPGVDGLRHPTQLYAILKDLLIAVVCFLHLQSSHAVGRTCGLFLILYAILRFIVEIFRDQPYGYTSALGLMFSRGQLLTIPLFVVGVWLWYRSRRMKN